MRLFFLTGALNSFTQIEEVRTIQRLRELNFTIGTPVFLFNQNGVNYYAATAVGHNKKGVRRGEDGIRCKSGVGPCRCDRIHFDEFGIIHSVRGKGVVQDCEEQNPVEEGRYYYNISEDEIWVE